MESLDKVYRTRHGHSGRRSKRRKCNLCKFPGNSAAWPRRCAEKRGPTARRAR